MPTAPPVAGTQVVARVAELLRIVARHPEGCRIARLVEESGLTRPTTYRLAASLAHEGLLDQDRETGAWRLGPEAVIWGTVAAARFPFEEVVRPSLRRLSEATGESSFFSIRRGDETVCLMREEGSFPVRSFVLAEGVRFPLGVASAGIAILAFLPEAEQGRIVADDAERVRRYGAAHAAASVRDALARTRRDGYSVNPGLILEGSWGMGAAVFDRAGAPSAALSLTGIEPRFSGERRAGLGRALLEEAHTLHTRLAARNW
ncbi:MAG: transcriptional regulator, IclR family [Agromyces sp.]|nr:transcriptional regulator, IclR family [Agromyces sp.]